MSVTRDVVTDLLPVYFSGEASEDSRRLVEEYFREHPDFERIARRAATPLETLRSAHAVTPDAEKEKGEMRRIGWELRSRRVWAALAAFYTLWPFVPFVSRQLGEWLGAPHTWGGRISVWCIAAFFWLFYIIRLSRRNLYLAGALLSTGGELVVVLNRLNIIGDQSGHATGLEVAGIGILAACLWIMHFRARMREQISRAAHP